MRFDKKRFFHIFITACFFIWSFSCALVVCFGQNTDDLLQSALEKYNNGDLNGALAELNAILKKEPDNLEARKLQNNIVHEMNKKESEKLTELALIEIDKKNFDNAQEFLKQAIKKDPDNKKARDLFLAIEEVKRAEGVKPGSEQIITSREQVGREEKPKQEQGTHDNFFITLSPYFASSGSNAVSGIDSGVTHLGVKAEAVYYFNLLGGLLGLSLDYSGTFLKLSGLDEINIIIHKADAFARFRIHLFETDSFRTELGVKAGYRLYYLQNIESRGAYNFTLLYGPAFGIFFSDPVLARFINNDFLKNCGIEGEAGLLLIPGEGNQAWIFNLDFYLGIYYRMGSFCYCFGYSYYGIMREALSETSHAILVGVRYYF